MVVPSSCALTNERAKTGTPENWNLQETSILVFLPPSKGISLISATPSSALWSWSALSNLWVQFNPLKPCLPHETHHDAPFDDVSFFPYVM